MNEESTNTQGKLPANSVSDTGSDIIELGYLSLSEASAQTPYSQEYISLLVRKGRLPGKKFGRNWHIKQADLDNYVAQQAQKATEKAESLGSAPANTVNLANLSQKVGKRQ